MQEVHDSSSWLLRTHYSRAVCYGTGTSTCGSASAMDRLNLDTTSVAPAPPVDIPKRRVRNGETYKSGCLDMQNIATPPIEHAPSLSAYCLQGNHDLISSLKSEKQIDENSHRLSTESSHGEQFSFISSASSSRNSLSSKATALSCSSPPSDTCFSPTSEMRNTYNFEPAMPDQMSPDHNTTGEPPSTENLSISHDTRGHNHSHGHDHDNHNQHHHHHHHNHFLRSVFSSLSRNHSRSSSSSSLCDNSHAVSNHSHSHDNHHHHHHHLHLSSIKGSLLKKLSIISPKSSPLASPTSLSPVVSPKKGSRSSPTSPDHTACGHVDVSDKKAMAPNMRRVPSWSHHFSNSNDGEKAVVSAEEWMLDLSQLLIGERFASGRHSRLYHGMYRDLPVAVKVIRPPDEDEMLGDRVEQIFNQEVTTLSRLQHHNIIKFIGACKKPPLLCVITEYLPGGSLRSFLHKREGALLPISKVLKMTLDIVYGMEYLHTVGIIHRDLKSENLVLDKDGCVKIVDFGVSCFESECSYRLDDVGTYRWMAPEMLSHKPHSKKVDVYSFGIVLWELITTRLPYEEMGAIQAAYSVINQNNRPPIPSDCPPQLADLMSQCWSSDPEQRPDFWEILRSLNVYKETLDEHSLS